jgi:DNA-3-methyladenine glycosylase II
LNLNSLLEGAQFLADRDPDLARVLEALGPPPLWARAPGFATLVYIILEQQVSLASARAAFLRLEEVLKGAITPENFLMLDDAALRAIGFSRQKTAYGRILAQELLEGSLDLTALPVLEDDAVRAELMKIKGIGRWTADIYLMEAILRPDIWPTGDLALAIAVKRVKNLAAVPRPAQLEELGQLYRPWRSVAARLFWHHYLSGMDQKPPYMPG